MRVLTATSTATIEQLAFAPDSSRLAAACKKANARVWDLASGKARALKNSRDVDFIGFARSADELVMASWNTPATLHDLHGGGVRRLGPARGPGYCWDTVLSPGGDRLIRVERRGVVCRSVANGRVLWEVPWNRDTIINPRAWFDAADDRVFFINRDVAILDAATGAEVGRFDRTIRQYESINTAALSPDGRWLAIRGTDGLHVHDTADGSLALEYPSMTYGYGLAFTPDGARLAATRFGGYPGIEYWSVAGWRHLKPVLSHIGPLTTIAFSPDGRLAAVGGYSGQVAVWDLK